MLLWREAPHLKAEGRLWRWSFGDYGPAEAGQGEVVALTPPSILTALRGGYRPRGDGLPGEREPTGLTPGRR
jgi:hypothetical protein